MIFKIYSKFHDLYSYLHHPALEDNKEIEMFNFDRLQDIKKRCDSATIGPWKLGIKDECCKYDPEDHVWCWTMPENCFCRGELAWETDHSCEGYGLNKADADFCANAREDIPYLLGVVSRLRRKKQKLHNHFCDKCKEFTSVSHGYHDNPDYVNKLEKIIEMTKEILLSSELNDPKIKILREVIDNLNG